MAETNFYSTDCKDQACPLRKSCNQFGPYVYRGDGGASTDNLDFLMYLDAPQVSEIAHMSPFASSEAEMIRKVVESEIPFGSYGMSYAVKGWPFDPNTPVHHNLYGTPKGDLDRYRGLSLSQHPYAKDIVHRCKPYLEREISSFRPKAIVVFGNTVAATLFPNLTEGINRMMEDYSKEYMGVPVRFLQSPAVLLRSPASKASWERNLRLILRGGTLLRDKTGPKSSHLIKTLPEAVEFIDTLMHTPVEVSTDTETLNLNKRYGNKLGTIQFCDNKNGAVCIPYLHPETPFGPDDIKILNQHLFKLFTQPSEIKQWIGYNLKFENHMFVTHFGTTIRSAPLFDCHVAAFLLDENRKERVAEFKYKPYSLKQVVLDYLNFDGYDQGILAKRDEGSLFDLPLGQVAEYGNMDAWVNRRLYFAQLEEARNQGYLPQLRTLMYSLYNLMIQLFVDIEQNGSPASLSYLRSLNSRTSPLLMRIAEIQEELKTDDNVRLANEHLLRSHNPLNRNITPIVRKPWVFDFAKQGHPQMLFNSIMGIKAIKTGVSGRGSVDEEWQTANKREFPLVAKYAEWVELRKMHDSFAVATYEYIDPTGKNVDCNTDSRIRPGYLLASVVTGRVACVAPNLQAIPRSDSGPKAAIKNIFQAIPGHMMVQLDYKANEMRWVGILAQDPKMADNFIRGKQFCDDFRANPTPEGAKKSKVMGDIHRMNASMAFGKDIFEVSDDERQKAKGISFGVLYDSSTFSISELYGIPLHEVESMFHKFFTEHNKIYEWKMAMKNNAKAYGYAETIHGRRRRFPIFDLLREPGRPIDERYVHPQYRGMVAEALRQASNAPVQGIASDAAYIGAGLFNNYIFEHKKPWFIQNAVHDSCVFQVPFEDVAEASAIAERCFTTDVMAYMTENFGINFNMPLEVEYEFGLKWGDLIKWNFDPTVLPQLIEDGRAGKIGKKVG